MPKYTKKWWSDVQQFRQATISREDLQHFLSNCKDDEEKTYLILLYYTGARPSELLKMRCGNIVIEENLLKLQILTLKKGIGRVIYINKKGKNELEIVENFVKNKEKDDLLFKKWENEWNIRDFVYRITDNTLAPYFFRHNRFTKLAQKGVSPFILKYLKGAKSVSSVESYVHIGGSEARKVSNLIE